MDDQTQTRLGGRPAQHAASGLVNPIRNRWAVLVGINRYVDPAIPALKFCVNDVLALQALLTQAGYTVVALHDNAPPHLQPTRINAEAELARICQTAGPDDLILAHFACHGKLENGQPVLLMQESRLPTVNETGLPLATVEQRLKSSQARRQVLLLDACHTGVELGRDVTDAQFNRNVYESALGFAMLAGSTSQQVAQEWGQAQHGVFTYYLLEGLSGKADFERKGFVTINNLSLYVLDQLKRWGVAHSGLLQEPTARIEGMGDMILLDITSDLAKASVAIPPSNTPSPDGAPRNGNAQTPLVDAAVPTDPRLLRQYLNTRFSTQELDTLITDLGIDYQNIPGDTKEARARELIQYLQRRGRLNDLIDALRAGRD